MKQIKFSSPQILKKDLLSMNNSINSGWLTHGQYSEKFEKEFINYTGSKYATTVSSCTAGLHLACMAIGLTNNDEVIVPAQTHTATAHSIEYVGAKAVFADIEIPSGNISPKEIIKKITKKTRAIILVHLTGMPCKIDEIISIAKKFKLIIIEDCAHALGSFYKNKHVGNFGIVGCFSFYPTKQITTGEGGMVISNNKSIINRITKLKAFGIDNDPKKRKIQGMYDVKNLGFNYRMTDFQACLGYFQLKRYKINLIKRKKIALTYEKYLKKIKSINYLKYDKGNSYFIFQIFLSSRKKRNLILKEFKNKNIGCSVHYFTPVPFMDYYNKKYNLDKKAYKLAQQYADQSISLPCHPDINEKDIKFIAKTLLIILKQ